jgi:hypothetical protein
MVVASSLTFVQFLNSNHFEHILAMVLNISIPTGIALYYIAGFISAGFVDSSQGKECDKSRGNKK